MAGDPIHEVTYVPETGRNDVHFGPKGEKPGHAVLREHELVYLRGPGDPPPAPTVDTGASVPKGKG